MLLKISHERQNYYLKWQGTSCQVTPSLYWLFKTARQASSCHSWSPSIVSPTGSLTFRSFPAFKPSWLSGWCFPLLKLSDYSVYQRSTFEMANDFTINLYNFLLTAQFCSRMYFCCRHLLVVIEHCQLLSRTIHLHWLVESVPHHILFLENYISFRMCIWMLCCLEINIFYTYSRISEMLH